MLDTTAYSKPARGARDVAPVALGDILDRIARRLAWYGLPQSGVCTVEIRNRDSVIATLTVAGNGTFREEFDGRTGKLRRRDAIDRVMRSRHARICPA